MDAVFDQDYVRNIHGPNLKEARTKMDKAAMLMDDIRQFQKRTGVARTVMVWCGSTEVFHRPAPVHETLKAFRGRAGEQRSRNRAEPDLRVRRAQDGNPVRERRAQPDDRYAGAARARARDQPPDLRQGLQDRADVHEDADRAGAEGAHARHVGMVLDQHPRQSRRRGARRSRLVQVQGRDQAVGARSDPAARAASAALQQTCSTR